MPGIPFVKVSHRKFLSTARELLTRRPEWLCLVIFSTTVGGTTVRKPRSSSGSIGPRVSAIEMKIAQRTPLMEELEFFRQHGGPWT